MTDEQISVRLDVPPKSYDDLLSCLWVEINHHIATENNVHGTRYTPARGDEVNLVKRHALAQFGDNAEPAGVGSVARQGVFLPQAERNGRPQDIGIDRLLRGPQSWARSVAKILKFRVMPKNSASTMANV